MGACITRDDLADDKDDSHLILSPVPLAKDNVKNGATVVGGPFKLRIRWGHGSRDLEGQALGALLDIVRTPKPRRPTAESSTKPVVATACIDALLALQAGKREALLDMVVPVTTVMLHAADKAVRRELWQFFVCVVVRTDNMLGHLFYWALRCVTDCPQAQEATKKEAARLLEIVGTELKKWKADLSNGDGISPLVDLFDKLHIVGDELVNEKEKGARQALLTSLLKKVNSKLPEATKVPLFLMLPDTDRRPGCLPGSALLRVPPTEGGVLSSKARAPYHVLVEADTSPMVTPLARARSALGVLCCKRARTNGAALGNLVQNGGLAGRKKEKKHKGLFGDQTYDEVKQRIRASSKYGKLPNWGLVSLIVKSSAEDIRQEEMAYRLLKWFQRVFVRHGLKKLWLRPFLILATTHDTGCLEAVENAISIDGLKKSFGGNWTSLKRYFEETFSDDGSGGLSLNDATTNFVESLAAYSIVCYVLCIRDRHNGNILLDDAGHIIHVDFGFMLCGSPGGRVLQQMGGFEPSQAFKLTSELMEVLDSRPELLETFRELVASGLAAVRTDAEELLALMQLSVLGPENSSMECFDSPKGYPEAVLEDICDRLCLPRAGGPADNVKSGQEFRGFVDRLIDDSHDHWRSRLYDTVQYMQNGIL